MRGARRPSHAGNAHRPGNIESRPGNSRPPGCIPLGRDRKISAAPGRGSQTTNHLRQYLDAEDQPRLPSIVVGLYLGILAAAKAQGLYVILLLTEPRRATRTDGTKVGSKARRTGARAEHRRTPIPSMLKSDLVAACLKSLLEAVA